jgi:hypothetical protein
MHKHGDCVQCEDTERQNAEWAQELEQIEICLQGIYHQLKLGKPQTLAITAVHKDIGKLAKEMRE